MLAISIRAHRLRRLYFALGILNTVALGAWALICSGYLKPGLMPLQELDPAQQLSLQAEHGAVAVWYSGALYLLVGVASIINYWSDQASRREAGKKRSLLRFGWLLLGAGAILLSLDESSQLHEGLGLWAGGYGGMLREGLTDASPIFAWIALLGPPLLVAALLIVAFFAYWLACAPRARTLGLIGILCWGAVPALEVVESRLTATFGQSGVTFENFVEESLEIVGATLLLIGAVEYLIARTKARARSAGSSTGSSGRGAVLAGVAMPFLALGLLAGLGLAGDTGFRGMVANTGYHFGAARVARVMDTVDRRGNLLVLSPSCDREVLKSAFAHGIRERGELMAYPPADERGIPPDFVLDTVVLADGEPLERTMAGLERAAVLSTHLWHLQCGPATDLDRTVETWLDRYSQDASLERLWLPGIPPVVLTHFTPPIPLPPIGEDYTPEAATFGEDEIELVGSRWFVDELDDETVLRVTLLWLVRAVPQTDYHVFVHLTDADGRPYAQSDGVPVYDRYPFGRWLPGEVVADSYDVLVPPDVSLDEAEIRVGLYDYETGERLSAGQSDHVRLAQPRVSTD